MAISLYTATVPGFIQTLTAVSGLIAKAKAHVAENGLPDEALTGLRLAPDMLPLANQFRFCWQAPLCALEVVRTGQTNPDFSDPPTDFVTIATRTAATLETLRAATEAEFEAAQGKDAAFVINEQRRLEFTTEDYLLSFVLPNFYFHATTAYDILRHQGFAIGKSDFLGAIRKKG